MPRASEADVVRMREHLFFEGEDIGRRLSRFWMLLTLAAVIAAAGVAADSTATVIGAMIVAPLMVPIVGTVVAVVLADRENLLRCFGLVVTGALAVIAIAFVLGLFVQAPVTAETNSQVAARVTPNIVDLVAALATGVVGSVALARDDISDTLPGVAIAISLVPPLAVVGLTLESHAPAQALGALLLFVANVCAILATGLVVMAIYGIQRLAAHVPAGTPHHVHRRRAAVAIVVSLLVITVPLAGYSYEINRNRTTESTVTDLATSWASGQGWELISVTTRPKGVLVRATGPLPEPDPANLQTSLDQAGLGDVRVELQLVPGHTVDLGDG